MTIEESSRSGSKHIGVALAVAASFLACAIAGPLWPRNPHVRAPGTDAPPAPTFTISQADLREPLTVIAYGDMRFTDPSNTTATNPTARQALAKRIAEEMPDAILLNGDVPWHGGDQDDYVVYRDETQAWRDAHLRVFPALGNHEFADCEAPQCLANWWAAFPKLKGLRWYSVLLGKRICVIALDSNDSLLPGSEQRHWLESQVASLPAEVQFVLITMHHPPVADIQTRFEVNHNPRPNEIALAEYLRTAAASSKVRFVVIAGHIHNYERFLQDGVVYLVSGGGGAKPYPVDRTPPDLYQDPGFPNYHYVKFVLESGVLSGSTYRFSVSGAPAWQAVDAFQVRSK
ncbi:MAG TPA: metallophosphoesterase [Candidatus Acidoferrum sp.]|nr:metallophosphoesterase [Candidatus Acidoferrum sp.]